MVTHGFSALAVYACVYKYESNYGELVEMSFRQFPHNPLRKSV